MQFTLSLPRAGVRHVVVSMDNGKDEVIGRVVGDYKVGFEPQRPDGATLCTRAHETPEDAAADIYACWLLRDLGASVLEHGYAERYGQCDDTCTVDCGHCKGAGKPVSERS